MSSTGVKAESRRGKRFRLVGVGGTFDIVHKGHEALLRKALDIGERVQIGIASDRFVKQMTKDHSVSPYNARAEGVRRFLQRENALERTDIVPIDDEHGTATTNRDLEALVVSKEKLHVAKQINELRKSSGLMPLELIEVGMVLADDKRPISASRIRRGEIDESGRVLKQEQDTSRVKAPSNKLD